jgi:hypothetical protein
MCYDALQYVVVANTEELISIECKQESDLVVTMLKKRGVRCLEISYLLMAGETNEKS